MSLTSQIKFLKQPLSLNLRVMSFVALAFGLSLLVIGYMVQHAVIRHFAEQDAEELMVITEAVESALQQAHNHGEAYSVALEHAVSGHHGVYFQVWDEANRLVFGDKAIASLTAWQESKPMPVILPDNLLHWSLDGKPYTGSVKHVSVDGHLFTVVAAIDADFHLSFLKSFRSTLWSIMLLTGAVSLLAAYYGVYRGLSPLRKLSEVIHDVGAEHLNMRLSVANYPTELQGLAVSFNQMIGSLESSFTQLSHFSDDIAHELRTPLTNIITQTQVALAKSRTLDEYRELHYSNLEELEHLARMVNDMLWLAKSDHGLQQLTDEVIQPATEIAALFEFFEALAEERNIRLTLEGDAPQVKGDRGMFKRAISNLLSNALRHAPPETYVKVQLDTLGTRLAITVANPGEAIESQHLPRLFDRFFRVDPARQRKGDGTGLGLAIVKSIVEAHQGTVSVSSDVSETRFTITLPISAEASD